MINFSADEKRKADDVLAKMASVLLSDKNRIAKAIAAFIRNELEDFKDEYTLVAAPSNGKLR